MSAEAHGAPPGRAPGGRRQPGPLHLLWAMPLAIAVTVALTVVAGLAACGVSGCSGGGFGPVTDRQPLAGAMVLIAGVVLGAPLLLVGWARRRGVQQAVAATVALGWAGWAWLSITGVL